MRRRQLICLDLGRLDLSRLALNWLGPELAGPELACVALPEYAPDVAMEGCLTAGDAPMAQVRSVAEFRDVTPRIGPTRRCGT
jgi:hypothetical protein